MPHLTHPGRPITAALLVTALAAPGLFRLELATDGRALVPARDPTVAVDRELRARYGERDPLVIVLATGAPGGLWNPAPLRAIQTVHAALAALPDVGTNHVFSLAALPGPRLEGLRTTTLYPLELTTAEQAQALREDYLALGLPPGLVVSRDEGSAAVYLGVPPGVDRLEHLEQVTRTAREAAPGLAFEVLGAPVAESLLGDHILADLGLPRSWLPAASEGLHSPAGGFALGLGPLALLVMTLVFWWGFRQLFAALLPLAKLGCLLVVVLGLHGWLGVPIYLTTAVLPVFLVAVGVADEVHLLRRARELAARSPGASSREIVAQTVRELRAPVVHTSVTTAVGFLSFAVSPIGPVVSFGLAAAIGVMLLLLWSLTVTPALLVLAPRRFWAGHHRAAGETVALPRWATNFASLAFHRRRALAWTLAGFALAAGFGITQLEVRDSWVAGFDPESSLPRASRAFDRDFVGSDRLLIEVTGEGGLWHGQVKAERLVDRELRVPFPADLPDPRAAAGALLDLALAKAPEGSLPPWRGWVEAASREGDELVLRLTRKRGPVGRALGLEEPAAPATELRWELRRPALLAPPGLLAVAALEEHLANQPQVGGVVGPAGQLRLAERIATGSPTPDLASLDDPIKLRAAWSRLRTALGAERVERFLHTPPTPDARTAGEPDRGLVSVFLPAADSRGVDDLFAELGRYQREELAPLGLTLRYGGDVAVSQALIAAVVRTQLATLALSLIALWALGRWFTGTPRGGLLLLAAPAVAIAVTFAAMGFTGIPLGVATSMFASLALGIGVDYSIHLYARHHQLTAEGPAAPEATLAAALASVVPSLLLDVAAVAGGFAVLLLSRVPTNARLGLLLGLALGACLLATLVVVPAGLQKEVEDPNRACAPTIRKRIRSAFRAAEQRRGSTPP